MQLLSLGAVKGTPLQVTAEGLDEEATLQDLSELFEDGAGISDLTNHNTRYILLI
jgi:phosphotransferase system HPr-like phosphotransfer protein